MGFDAELCVFHNMIYEVICLSWPANQALI